MRRIIKNEIKYPEVILKLSSARQHPGPESAACERVERKMSESTEANWLPCFFKWTWYLSHGGEINRIACVNFHLA
jgi:hypothetical protein